MYQHELDKVVKMYILRHFNEIAAKSQEILQISFDIFFEIINDDLLNVKAEEPVWECCLRWIDYDVDYRKQFVPKLLSGVRLGLMNLQVNSQLHTYMYIQYIFMYNTLCRKPKTYIPIIYLNIFSILWRR